MKSAKEEKGKKISILYILRILKEFSDEKHPLSQKQIIELLDSKYGQAINRKSVKRDLEKLKDAGFPTVRQVRGHQRLYAVISYRISRKFISMIMTARDL